MGVWREPASLGCRDGRVRIVYIYTFYRIFAFLIAFLGLLINLY